MMNTWLSNLESSYRKQITMYVNPSLKRKFPKFAQWIIDEIPYYRSNPKVFNAFVKYSQLSQHVAGIALTPGWLPEIDIAIMPDYGQYRGENRWGRPRKRQLHKIYLPTKLCRRFERPEADQRSYSWSLIFAASILHEMVHWGDFISDGIRQPNSDVYDQVHDRWWRNADVGFQFEEEAFNGIYTVEYLKT
jgi:hypothetical protein